MTKNDIITLITKDKWMVEILKIVRTLNLNDWYIGAGFVRSKVWDELHSYKKRTPIPDIDVIYFNKSDYTREEENNETTTKEIEYESKLKKMKPEINWSVTNQARMHTFHHDSPYKSSEEALSRWVETATCVGVKIDVKNEIVLAAPLGIEDLVNLKLRPTLNTPENRELFLKRVAKKGWLQKWPKLKIVDKV